MTLTDAAELRDASASATAPPVSGTVTDSGDTAPPIVAAPPCAGELPVMQAYERETLSRVEPDWSCYATEAGVTTDNSDAGADRAAILQLTYAPGNNVAFGGGYRRCLLRAVDPRQPGDHWDYGCRCGDDHVLGGDRSKALLGAAVRDCRGRDVGGAQLELIDGEANTPVVSGTAAGEPRAVYGRFALPDRQCTYTSAERSQANVWDPAGNQAGHPLSTDETFLA